MLIGHTDSGNGFTIQMSDVESQALHELMQMIKLSGSATGLSDQQHAVANGIIIGMGRQNLEILTASTVFSSRIQLEAEPSCPLGVAVDNDESR